MQFGQEFDRVARMHLVRHLVASLAEHGHRPLTDLLALSVRYRRLQHVTLGELLEAASARHGPSDAAILDKLRVFGQWVPSAVIATLFGMPVPQMRKRLRDLVRARQVVVHGRARGTRYMARGRGQ